MRALFVFLFILFYFTRPVVGFDGADTSISSTGDPEAGQTVYRSCQACHNVKGGSARLGPNLDNIFGRMAGTAPGYNRYSKALRESGIVWSETELDQWLKDPRNYLPGNKMPFAGIRSEQDRANLIAYLRQATEGN